MNLNVEKLREACRSGIELAKQRQAAWDVSVDAAEAEWERAWREDILPQWKPFRDELTKAFKTGGQRAGFRNMHKLFEAAANGVWE